MIIVGKGNLSLKMIAKNINIWSILVGAFLFAFQIKLPNIINGTLSSIDCLLAQMPCLLRQLIAAIPLKSIISSKRIYLVTLLRLLVIPFVLLVLIKLIGFVHWVEKGGDYRVD